MKFSWTLAPLQPALAGQLARALGITPLLAQCLLNRDQQEPVRIGAFLQPRLKHLADPFLLPNMGAAIDRLIAARTGQEPLVIFGDYDVDGVTSTALLLEVFRGLGWSVSYYLPNRMDEGYGLSQEAVENCLRKYPAKLLLAVDCGSTTANSVAWLQAQGVDVIVLDHHQVSSPPPPALALVNPQLSPDAVAPAASRPGIELCSAGLAFKLAHALIKRGRQIGLPGTAEFDLRPLLDLVALGTIADLVPLTGENRILVSIGLDRLNSTQRPGLAALKRVAQCSSVVGAYEVGFQLAPRLNAAGRLETAEDALRLLMARDPGEALLLAQNLDQSNRERQKIERGILEEALGAVRAKFDPARDFVIVEGERQWHIGVVGIVASRVLQQFHRPTIIVGGDGEHWRGSGRSIAGFNLVDALRECTDLLVRHGGHAMAAGLTIHPDQIDAFRSRLNEVARRVLNAEALQPRLRLDAEVRLAELNLPCLSQLDQLKPMGQGNPGVQLCARNLSHLRPLHRLGADKQHVKMWVTDRTAAHEAVWWGAGDAILPANRFDLAFVAQINEYEGRRTVQLRVLDWRQAGD
jgi:single-stranded-DNA-specific exonuclease